MPAPHNDDDGLRLDKWLWAARFYKTRALARAMIEGGKVHYNGQRAKPSKQVELGARLKLWQGDEEKEIEIRGLSGQRRPADEAQRLYQETADSLARRERNAEARRLGSLHSPKPDTKPDKKQRRDLLRWKQG
ncbi:ribosome-associated heat shock protein Hsp15 [Pseudaeromonas paramecii]|uniref:Heat shock protein 15 n=1 Tax=Pseudaeromonas paramecii TaxID=2138166 RepID=A0ABP8QKH2_9GAMM